MNEEEQMKAYGIRYRILVGIGSLLTVLGTVYVIYLETRLPFDYFILIGIMIVCALFLVHVGSHIALTGHRPAYMQATKKKKADKEIDSEK